MDKSLKETVLDSLKNIKVSLQEAGIIKKDEPVKFETADGKEFSVTGELVAGVEIKLEGVTDGTIELKDGRKMEVKESKFVKFEVAAPAENLEGVKAELAGVKTELEAQKEVNKTLEAKFAKVIECSEQTLKAVESIALAMESEPDATKGGNEGDKLISKSEWVTKQMTSK